MIGLQDILFLDLPDLLNSLADDLHFWINMRNLKQKKPLIIYIYMKYFKNNKFKIQPKIAGKGNKLDTLLKN